MGFLGVRLDQELEEKIKATGRPKSEVVRDALRAYFEVDRSKQSQDQEGLVCEIERLLDEKILALNTVKQPPPKRKQKVFNAVKQEPGQADEIIMKAAQRILDYFDEGREPLNAEIAEELGLSSGSLGMYLKQVGIKATPTGRSGVKGRYFTFDLRAKLEDVLDTPGGVYK
jgi:predicted transcriptional regulator